MNDKEIREAQSKLNMRLPAINQNEAYFEGKNPCIMNKPTEKKPDNRIPVPLAKMAVEKMSGYAGRKGDIVSEYDLIDGTADADNDDFLNYIRAMNEYNDEELETAELYEETNIQGEACELWWVSDAMTLDSGLMTAEYKIVPIGSVYLHYTNDIKKALDYGIHFSGDQKLMTATVYEAGLQTTYESTNGSAYSMIEDGEVITPFTQVPINMFRGNRRGTPLFEAEKHLIDTFDQLISKSINEVDRFNAMVALFGSQVDQNFVKAFEEAKIAIIDNLDNGENAGNLPRYLEKNLSGVNEFYNSLADRVEKLIIKSIGTPDFTDEAFAGAQTGIALKLKLVGMEFKAAQIETYFNKGLKNRLYLYADIYNASTKHIEPNDYKINIKANRNLPIDDEAKLRIAAMLMGLGLDLKHIVNYLPNSIIGAMTEQEIEAMMGVVIEEQEIAPPVEIEEAE